MEKIKFKMTSTNRSLYVFEIKAGRIEKIDILRNIC